MLIVRFGSVGMSNQAWIIKRNTERYPDSPHSVGRNWPDLIIVQGTLEQVRTVAECLSNFEAGCDYYFYIVGVDDE